MTGGAAIGPIGAELVRGRLKFPNHYPFASTPFYRSVSTQLGVAPLFALVLGQPDPHFDFAFVLLHVLL